MEDGKFTLLWLKYAAVLHVLLKNTDTENQKLQMFKHEFENTGQKQKANVAFSIDLIQGRAVNVVATTTIARDLWQVLDNRSSSKNMLKERRIRITLGKSFELELEKISDEVLPVETSGETDSSETL
ncbi:MAG: hypothetical protein WCL06_02145 [Bacteroidota bacterium]